MDRATENVLGVTRETECDTLVVQNFKSDTHEAGVYLAMARQAERDGFPEVALSLRRISNEKLMHAARFAELNGMLSTSTRENLERALQREEGTSQVKRDAAAKAREAGIDEAHDALDEAARDDARFARSLKGLLERYH